MTESKSSPQADGGQRDPVTSMGPEPSILDWFKSMLRGDPIPVAQDELAEPVEERERVRELRSKIPDQAYETPLEEVGLSTRVLNLLTDANYETAGAVLEKLALEEKAIRNIPGVGPKSVEEMQETLEEYDYPEPEPEPEPEPVEEEPEVEPEPVAEAVAAEEAEVEEAPEPEPEPVPEPAMEAEETEEEEEPVPAGTIDEAFEAIAQELETEVAEFEEFDEDEEEDEEDEEEKRRKKRKKRVVEYDPELDEMIVRRRRKPSRRDEEEWDKYGDI